MIVEGKEEIPPSCVAGEVLGITIDHTGCRAMVLVLRYTKYAGI